MLIQIDDTTFVDPKQIVLIRAGRAAPSASQTTLTLATGQAIGVAVPLAEVIALLQSSAEPLRIQCFTPTPEPEPTT